MQRLLIFLLSLTALACTPATVTTQGCKSSADCTGGDVCVDQVCQAPGSIACDDDLTCEPYGATCVNGYCSTASMVDAGVDEDAAVESDSGSVVTGDGVIAVENELPVDFGSPLFGAEVVRVITLRNVGEGALQIYRVDRAPGTSEEFQLDPEGTAADTVLQPEQTLDITVRYVLADGTADIGELVVISDAMACEGFCEDPAFFKLPLYSEFKGARNLAVSPASHDFGFVAEAASSLFAPITLINDGTLTKVLTVSALRLEGADAAQFELLNDPLPYYLTPAADQIVRVRYAPAVTAFHSAELVVEANSDDPQRQEVRVSLTGRSVPSASLTISSPVDFGELEIGQSVTRTTTVHNGGGMAATLTAPERFAAGDQGFAMVSPTLPQTIAPGEQVTFTLSFAPAVAGDLSDTFYLDHDASGSPLEVALSGRGREPPQGYSDMRIEQSFTTTLMGTEACSLRVNHQNVDLELAAGAAVCDKNAGGCQADVCNCNLGSYGSAVWSCNNCGGLTSTKEIISNFGSGSDGSFDVRAYYFDDCAAGYYVDATFLQPICSFPGTREACFPIEVFPHWYVDGLISETQCMYGVAAVGNRCMGHAATKVRTIIHFTGGTSADQSMHFCTDLSSANERQPVARVERSAGLFNLVGPLGTTSQIAPTDSCGN